MVLSILWEAGFMLRELMILAGLLLATYGLANVITAAVLWFTVPVTGKPYVMLIYLHENDPIRSLILSARERLNNGGLYRCAVMVAVDCGLDEKHRKIAEEYCDLESIALIKNSELDEYLKKHSFQIEQNKV